MPFSEVYFPNLKEFQSPAFPSFKRNGLSQFCTCVGISVFVYVCVCVCMCVCMCVCVCVSLRLSVVDLVANCYVLVPCINSCVFVVWQL